MSEAKEGKLLGRKKLLDPHLGTTEGTKITSTTISYTSHAPTVYSNDQPTYGLTWVGAERFDQCDKNKKENDKDKDNDYDKLFQEI